jgi:imidazolonepropionase-like amidohydrolase
MIMNSHARDTQRRFLSPVFSKLPSSTAMRRFTTFSLITLLFLLNPSKESKGHDEVPGAPQKQAVALVKGTIHTVSGEIIEGGVVLFENGKITRVSTKTGKLPAGTRVVDIQGKHVYPGLFEAHTQLGLVEINAVRSTRDYAETGSINPNVEARVAVNPDSELIPVTRANGVLLALSAPSRGLISGKSTVLQLDGWTFEDLTLLPQSGLHVNWPRQSPVLRVEGSGDEDSGRRSRGTAEDVDRLREIFDDARAYLQARKSLGDQLATDLRLESMAPVLDGRVPMIVAADGASEIQSAVSFAVEQDVRLVILGGYDAPMCADLLKKHRVPVIISAVHRMPRNRHDAYDDAYTLPERLRQLGVEYCISGTDRSETWNARNLAYHAGTAVAYGLPEDEAIRAITLYPAKILGVEDRVGSLEEGKDATLIVTDGNPLETTTQVEMAFVQGRPVALTSRHTRLYDKYRQKYRQLRP